MSYKPMRVTEAARALQVTPQTVRNWCNDGRLPYTMSAAGQRVFDRRVVAALADGKTINTVADEHITVFYVRSSSGSDVSMDTQVELLTAEYGEPHKIYRDKASGLSESRRGLDALLTYVEKSEHNIRVCVTNRDRLSRFGTSFIERIISARGGELVEMGSSETKEPQEVLLADFMSLLASFSGKFYRIRGWEQQRMLAQRVTAEVDSRALG